MADTTNGFRRYFNIIGIPELFVLKLLADRHADG